MTNAQRQLLQANEALTRAVAVGWGRAGIKELRALVDRLTKRVDLERRAAKCIKQPAGALFNGNALPLSRIVAEYEGAANG